MKYAVYVEGLAELLFVADVLSKYSGYDSQKIGYTCINLISGNFDILNSPKQGDLDSSDYYQIVNVNGGYGLLSKIRKDINGLIKNGYQVIIGLKDVYGLEYEQFCKRRVVDHSSIQTMHDCQTSIFKGFETDFRLHFAIMEYETWMLALVDKYLAAIGESTEDVSSELGFDVFKISEDSFFHPSDCLKKIFEFVGKRYGKHESNQLSFLSKLGKEDYEQLRLSGRCPSFTNFLNSLLSRCPNPLSANSLPSPTKRKTRA